MQISSPNYVSTQLYKHLIYSNWKTIQPIAEIRQKPGDRANPVNGVPLRVTLSLAVHLAQDDIFHYSRYDYDAKMTAGLVEELTPYDTFCTHACCEV